MSDIWADFQKMKINDPHKARRSDPGREERETNVQKSKGGMEINKAHPNVSSLLIPSLL